MESQPMSEKILSLPMQFQLKHCFLLCILLLNNIVIVKHIAMAFNVLVIFVDVWLIWLDHF